MPAAPHPCLNFFWNSGPFDPPTVSPQCFLTLVSQDEKILFGHLFFLHFSLGRQDNHLQEFLLRRKGYTQ